MDKNAYKNDESKNTLIIEHYECCHKPLPEFSNIESLSLVHHALGFLPEPSKKEILLEEIDSDEEDIDAETAVKQVQNLQNKIIHCIKVINGELFLFCNIKTRRQFKQ
jgi:hypothetical protein